MGRAKGQVCKAKSSLVCLFRSTWRNQLRKHTRWRPSVFARRTEQFCSLRRERVADKPILHVADRLPAQGGTASGAVGRRTLLQRIVRGRKSIWTALPVAGARRRFRIPGRQYNFRSSGFWRCGGNGGSSARIF